MDAYTVEVAIIWEGEVIWVGSPGKFLVGTGNLGGSNFRDAEPLSGRYVIHLFGCDFSVFTQRRSAKQKQKAKKWASRKWTASRKFVI